MELIWGSLPWIFTMAVLIGCSAFFSASEAALFSLQGPERRSMARGTAGERMADTLLKNPDRLLSAVLFWNLLVNLLYFSIATMIGTRWDGHPTLGVAFAVASLFAIVFFSEMLPKSLGVLSARSAASVLSVPMMVAVRAVDPIMPALRTVNLLSRRLIWPDLEEQPHLESRDLERAIEMSQTDPGRVEGEKTILHNIVQLSDLQAQEWMRPRKVLRGFCPPVRIVDLREHMTPSGYLLVTDEGGDEITAALDLAELSAAGAERLDRQARPVAYVPWCSTVADVLEVLKRERAQVASVVNESGETIGIITMRDIFDALLTEDPHRSERLLNRKPIVVREDGGWEIDGMTNLRRLHELVDVEFPVSRNVTLGGVMQETLEHLPQAGDVCQWGPFNFEVLEVSNETDLLLHVTVRMDMEEVD